MLNGLSEKMKKEVWRVWGDREFIYLGGLGKVLWKRWVIGIRDWKIVDRSGNVSVVYFRLK